MNWYAFWNGSSYLNPLFIILRVTILYFALFGMNRLMGPRQVGIVSAFNFIIQAGMGHIATTRMTNHQSSLIDALITIGIGAVLGILLSWMDYKFPEWVGTRPIVLVQDGQLLHDNLRKAHITVDDLRAQLRLKKAHNLKDIAVATLEPMGELSVIKKAEATPLTWNAFNFPVLKDSHFIVLIYNGLISYGNLKAFGIDQNWLVGEITNRGYSISQLYSAILDPNGNIHVKVKTV